MEVQISRLLIDDLENYFWVLYFAYLFFPSKIFGSCDLFRPWWRGGDWRERGEGEGPSPGGEVLQEHLPPATSPPFADESHSVWTEVGGGEVWLRWSFCHFDVIFFRCWSIGRFFVSLSDPKKAVSTLFILRLILPNLTRSRSGKEDTKLSQTGLEESVELSWVLMVSSEELLSVSKIFQLIASLTVPKYVTSFWFLSFHLIFLFLRSEDMQFAAPLIIRMNDLISQFVDDVASDVFFQNWQLFRLWRFFL